MDLIQTYLLEYLLLLGQKSLQSSQMQCTYKMYLSVQAFKSSSKLNDQKPCGCGFKSSPPPTILNIFFTIILDFFSRKLVFIFSRVSRNNHSGQLQPARTRCWVSIINHHCEEKNVAKERGLTCSTVKGNREQAKKDRLLCV